MTRPPFVQTEFDFAIREINALEVRIVTAEDDADDMLWEQARQVVEQLDTPGGPSQRTLAKQWINTRNDNKPYSERHVRIIKQMFTAYLNTHPRPRFRKLYNEITNADKTETTARDRREAAAEARIMLATTPDDYGVRLGAARSCIDDLDAGSVSLVFTDPPYHDTTIDVYDELGAAASHVLADGGSLITYGPQHRLPDICAALQGAGLTYFWPIALLHEGGSLARMHHLGIIVHWKLLLWFVKGTNRRPGGPAFLDDVVRSPHRDKTHHPWQQHADPARYYIEALTLPGELVVDPFCGSGTTALVAAELGRRWITYDVDPDAVVIARSRLKEIAP